MVPSAAIASASTGSPKAASGVKVPSSDTLMMSSRLGDVTSAPPGMPATTPSLTAGAIIWNDSVEGGGGSDR